MDTSFLDEFGQSLSGEGASYFNNHKLRYAKTIEMMPAGEGFVRALDVGGTSVYHYHLVENCGYESVDITEYKPSGGAVVHAKSLGVLNREYRTTAYALDLEKDVIPAANEYYDLILLCEVLEHFAVDPMFALSELNRVLRSNGVLLLTTPNACSARNLYKLLNLENPNFFLCYNKNGTTDRHNLEYSPNMLRRTLDSAGFVIEQLRCIDVFEPRLDVAYDLLKNFNTDESFRGDDIMLIARKVSAAKERYPSFLYV